MTPNPTPTPIPVATPGLILDEVFEDAVGLGLLRLLGLLGDEEEAGNALGVERILRVLVLELGVEVVLVGVGVGSVNSIFQPTIAMAPTVELRVRLVVSVCQTSELSVDVDA